MKREIRLENVIKEIKRNLVAVLAVSMAMALVMCIYSYLQVKNNLSGIQYGTKLVMMMDSGEESRRISEFTNATQEYESFIKGDEIIRAVISENPDFLADASLEEVRNSIYVQGRTYGRVMNIFVISDNQEKSTAICKSIEKNAATALEKRGIKVSIVQTTSEIGAARAEQREDYSDPEKMNTMIRTSTVPSFGLSSAIKKLAAGFVFGFICATIWIFAVYVVKGKLRYGNELSDIGIVPLGRISADKAKMERDITAAVGSIFMGETDDPVTLIPYGCKSAAEAVLRAAEERINKGIAISTEDVLMDPLARLEVKPTSEAVMLLKAGRMKIEEVFEEKVKLESAGNMVKGALIAE